MKKYRKLIKNNLYPGDCGLWYDVLIWNGCKFVHCVCLYKHCNSYTDALVFYFKHYHKPWYIVHSISHHKYSNKDLQDLAMYA